MRLASAILALALGTLSAAPLAQPDGFAFGPQQEMEANPLGGPASDLVLYALSLNGTAYRYGGRDPQTGLDCSGFVSHVFRTIKGLELPRSAQEMSRLGQPVPLGALQPGDLVFFNTLRRAFSHVGIYLGNHQFIHATSSKTGDVMISNMKERYWASRFDGARRLALAENRSD